METYIKSFFWVGLASVVLRLILISAREYPHTAKTTLGSDLVRLIEEGFWVAWAAIVLWWTK